ncbi:TorF family putative porin [Pseudomonas plecoglossicida]|uniref:TorF family putative porin n=1 Tax=Pseudomonas plecoglossicida TaxID=70775 RepID=UPI003977A44E
MKITKKYFAPALFLAPWTFANAIDLGHDLTLSVNVGAFSNYWSRGVSQTQNDPALQGSLTLSHSSGAYLGVWSSNVDFGSGSKTRQELDYYVGYVWQPNENFSWDVAYYKYEYPRESSLNYSEYYTKLTAYGFNVGGWYSDDLYGNQSYLYSFVGYTANLPFESTLDLTYGNVDYKDNYFFSKSGGERDSYNAWIAKLSKSLLGIKWSVAYADSSLSKSECASFNGFDDVCSSTVIFGAEKTF